MNKQIILIMTDSQRADMLGCYGNKDMITPNLDKLSARGIRFDKAYTCQPVCGPARSALFTGTFPHSNGVWANNMALGDNVKTIGQRLRDNRIHTAYIGKWHLDGADYFGLGKCPDGWDKDYWYDMKCYLEELSEEERLKSRNIAVMDQADIKEEFTFGHRCVNRAIDFLNKNKEKDFFMVLSLDEPHDPSLCPAPYSRMYDSYQFSQSENVSDTLENKPEHHRIWSDSKLNADKEKLKASEKYLLSCNSYIDYEIGRVLEQIDELAPDALIIYTSDHGDMMRSHGLALKGPAAYDEITRIPLIVKGGNFINNNSVYGYPVSHIDLAPTILDYMGVKIPKLIEGKSLIPALRDTEKRINECIFMEFGRYEIDHDGFGGFQPFRCVYDGKFKLCVNLLSSDELYDLEADPSELNNLIDDERYQEIRNRNHDILLAWMNDTRDPFRGYYWERRPWRKDVKEVTWEYTGCTRQRENEEYEPRQLDYCTGLEMESAVRKK